MNIAVASYGGPIAVARKQKEQFILLDAGYKDNILFFSNQGTLMSQIRFVEEYKKGDIIGFDFILDE